MKRVDPLRKWLVEPPVKGLSAIPWTVVAIAVPTLIRASVDSFVIGCETIAFIPAVLLTAIFLGWRYAAVVALAASVIVDAVFLGHDHALVDGLCDLFGVSGILVTSALVIGFVQAVRFIVSDLIEERTTGIVFSTSDGQAWASWYGRSARIHLGGEQEVAEMMEDYLAQLELGKQLANSVR